MSTLDTFLSGCDVSERHSIKIERPAAQVMAAVSEVTVAEMPLARSLFWLRSLPDRLRSRRRQGNVSTPLLGLMLAGGFTMLAEEPGGDLVIGSIGQFWRVRGPRRLYRAGDREDFIAFNEAGFAKAVLSFETRESGGVTTLSTETRVLATDPAARRRFRRYWRVVGPGSALTRRSLLAAVRRRAGRN